MRLFLSYSSPDYDEAEKLRQVLLARRPDLEIYLAARRNDIGAYWIARLDAELREADALLLLLGRRVGPWQELEYYDALHRNRSAGRPLIAPVVLFDSVPGLPFLEQFHHLSYSGHSFDDLIDRVLAAIDGAAVEAGQPAWQLTNPYRGLLAMETRDAAFFFGREQLTGDILTRMAEAPDRIHTLVGNSGVGKSSVAMAGVIAALKSRLWPDDMDREWPPAFTDSHRWPVIQLKPGEHPVRSLAQACASLWLSSPAEIEAESLKWQGLLMGGSSLSALIDATLNQLAMLAEAEPPGRMLLYVDQCEELYSRAAADEALQFGRLLAEAVAKPNLVAMTSLRSDYYGRIQADGEFFSSSAIIDVTPLDRPSIERIIRLPAERLGVRFERPDMIAHIAEAAAREPGSMPMLSDLLADAWRSMARDSGSGGVLQFPFKIVDISRPLADKADRFFTVHRAQAETLRRLITLKLALVPKEGEIVRRRARREECSDAEWALIGAMAEREWRLVTTGDEAGRPTAEVAHEALLRHWPRAARWLDDSREFLIWKGQLEAEHRIWARADEADRPRALLTGLRLDVAGRWLHEREGDLSKGEIDYIRQSEDAARRAEDRRQAAQARLIRQRKWIQRIVLSAMIIVSVVAAYAFWQSHEARLAKEAADTERDRAVTNEKAANRQATLAEARRLAMAAERVLEQNIGETTLAGLLATRSLQRSETREGRRVLRRVLALTPRRFEELDTPWPWSRIQHSGDGKLAVFSRLRNNGSNWRPASGAVGMVNTRSWRIDKQYDYGGAVWPLISPDGNWMAIVGYGRRLQIFDLRRDRQVLDVRQDDMINGAFGPQDQYLYIARTDGVIEVREAPSWQMVRTLAYPTGADRPLRVTLGVRADGRQLMVIPSSASPVLVPIAGGSPLVLGDIPVRMGRFSPSGNYAATTARGHELTVWNPDNGAAIGSYKHDVKWTTMAISPDGTSIVLGTRSGKVLVINADSGAVRRELYHRARVNDVDISPDGKLVATASDDRSAVVWDLATAGKLCEIAHEDEVWEVVFGTGAKTLFSGSKDGEVREIEAATGRELRRLQVPGGVRALLHHSGTGMLAVSIRGTEHNQAWTDLKVVDRKAGAEMANIEHNGGFSSTAFSPDGLNLATATGGSGDVKIWDLATGTPKVEPGIQATSLHFSPDGERLIVGNSFREATIVDTSDGRPIAALGEPGGVEAVRVAPDRRTIITFGQDGTFRAWDAGTGHALWVRQARRPDYFIEISGDGQRFADLSADRKTIEVGEIRSGQSIAAIPAGQRAVFRLSQDGRRLILARSNLTDPGDPKRRFSEVELWDVGRNERILKRRLQHANARCNIIPGGRMAIVATRTLKNEPEGFLEVIDGTDGKRLWSATVETGFLSLHPADGQGDVMVIGTPSARQVVDPGTGRLIFKAAEGDVRATAAHRDRALVVIGSRQINQPGDDGIEIRDLNTGRIHRRIVGTGTIRDLGLSIDGRFIFAAVDVQGGSEIRAWHAPDGSEITSIEMDATPRSVEPLSDPDLLAVYDNADTLRIWRISSGEEVHRFSHTLTATDIAVAAGADRAVTWREGSLRIWNTRNGAEIAHRLSHGSVTRLEISPDGETVAYLTDRPRTVRRASGLSALVIWEPDRGDEPIVLPVQRPRKIEFDPTGRWLAVQLGDETIRVLELATLRTIDHIQPLPGGSVKKLFFSEDGARLHTVESARRQSSLRVFDIRTIEEIARIDVDSTLTTMPGPDEVAARDKLGRWLSRDVNSAGPDTLVWPASADRKIGFDRSSGKITLRLEAGESGSVPALLDKQAAMVPKIDGRYLSVWAVDPGTGRIASMTKAGITINAAGDGRQLALWPGVSLHGGGQYIGYHYRRINGMTFLDGGAALVVHDTREYGRPEMRSRLWMWRWQTGTPQLISDQNPINMVAVSPSGDFFATAEGGNFYDDDKARNVSLGASRIRVWRSETGAVAYTIPMDDAVDAVAFSPDGTRMAARMAAGIVVYRVADQAEIARFKFKGERTTALGVGFVLGGRQVVAATSEGVQIWGIEGRESRLLRHERGWPRFTLSADGRLIATRTDQVLRIWDAATGSELFEMGFGKKEISNVLFVGPNHELVAITNTGLVKILWKSDSLIDEACRRFGRNISPAESRQFFGDGSPPTICPEPISSP